MPRPLQITGGVGTLNLNAFQFNSDSPDRLSAFASDLEFPIPQHLWPHRIVLNATNGQHVYDVHSMDEQSAKYRTLTGSMITVFND